ncbi:Uncharacterized protein GBIM_04607, partial [Gryllus bimaculatus]
QLLDPCVPGAATAADVASASADANATTWYAEATLPAAPDASDATVTARHAPCTHNAYVADYLPFCVLLVMVQCAVHQVLVTPAKLLALATICASFLALTSLLPPAPAPATPSPAPTAPARGSVACFHNTFLSPTQPAAANCS